MKKMHPELYAHDFTAKFTMANIAIVTIDEDWVVCQGWLAIFFCLLG
jgi:hypothetical protein